MEVALMYMCGILVFAILMYFDVKRDVKRMNKDLGIGEE